MAPRHARSIKWMLLVVWFPCPAAFGQRQVTVPGGTNEKPARGVPVGSAYAMPNNFYGVHLLVDDGRPGTKGYKHLQWARHLVGKWGYAKTLFMGVDERTTGPAEGWVEYVKRCYALELIPLIRLGGNMKNGQWLPPRPDQPGDYHSMAEAVRRVVQGFPRCDLCPLYIELWNEPNVSVEWAGNPDPQEYADFFVQAAEAIRSIGDDRIRILNGGLATSSEWAEMLCKADPKFISSFDVWASHPYPHNHPPSVNFHDRTAPPHTDLTIDSYVQELEVLKRLGRPGVRVMLTETGYDLGNSAHAKAGYPIINEYNRADYMVRAFRDYWAGWPEVVGVFPFEFCNEGWERFDWVYPDSGVNADGSPTKPHYQYTAVAALAKPTDLTGAVNGTLTVAKLGSRLEGATVGVHLKPTGCRSDPMGNYFLPKLAPGKYRIIVSNPGFADFEQKVTVERGKNTVLDICLEAEETVAVTGTVLSGDDREPIRGVKITLEPGNLKAETDSKGRYEFKECVPARYTMRAEARGVLTYESTDVEVKIAGRNRHDFVMGRRRGPNAENMLTNGGFEAGGGGGAKLGIGLGFEPMLPAPMDFRDGWTSISSRLVHTGQHAQEMRMRREETAIRQITNYGVGKPGTHYVGGAWVRVASTDENAAAWITLLATRNDGSVIGGTASEKARGGSPDWIWLEARAIAPKGTQRISLGLHVRGTSRTSGSACFDDAYLGAVRKEP